MRTLSLAQARRVALAAQGLSGPRPAQPATMREVQRVLNRVAQFQIDSVNVCVRAHHMPLFSRLGPYDRGLLDRAWGRAPRRVIEYWGHAASLIDVNLVPALRWRMDSFGPNVWLREDQLRRQQPQLFDQVLAAVAEQGPLTARQIDHDEQRERHHWGWNWSSVKIALEAHFNRGTLMVAGRNAQFERLYDLPERVLPPSVRHAEPVPEFEARQELLRRAGRALGVFTENCVTDYFYLKRPATRAALAGLVASGEFVPVQVAGSAKPWWLWHEAVVPRATHAQALLSPFDSMMYQRDRLLALFDHHYRIEIYVPEAQRQFGYYVYSFVLGDQIVARVDLKADRAARRLVVRSCWLEPDARPDAVVPALAEELRLMASWLGLGDVVVESKGNGASRLGASMA